MKCNWQKHWLSFLTNKQHALFLSVIIYTICHISLTILACMRIINFHNFYGRIIFYQLSFTNKQFHEFLSVIIYTICHISLTILACMRIINFHNFYGRIILYELSFTNKQFHSYMYNI